MRQMIWIPFLLLCSAVAIAWLVKIGRLDAARLMLDTRRAEDEERRRRAQRLFRDSLRKVLIEDVRCGELGQAIQEAARQQ